jgi:hypothetical protein
VPKIRNQHVVIPIILAMISLSFFLFFQTVLASTNYTTDKTLSPISEVNTRIFTNSNITFKIPFNSTISATLVNSTMAKFGSGCPPEIAIYIHGFKRNDIEANEEFNRIQTSLTQNNYRIPLIGFSWDSNELWETAKTNAKDNGPMLALYITSFHEKCPSTDIRIIAHSLGAAVLDSALVNLNYANWTNKIASVHLLGAAIDNGRLADNTNLSTAAEAIVDKFYNLYNLEDDGLKFNQALEKGNPLGLVGAPKGTVHANYTDRNVAYEIPPFSDADGDSNVEECFEDVNLVKLWGDNHCGYIGFRNPLTGLVSDDGAMNIVVSEWRKP